MTASSVSKLYSAELEGIDARLVEVETDVNVGLHTFTIVGLADKALSEAKERVNSALKNIGVTAPNRENRKIIVNLAPADLKKNGSHYDLPIALTYLMATGQLKDFDSENSLFIGELSLDSKIRPIQGALNIARLAKSIGKRRIFVPKDNAAEAALVPGLEVIPASSLMELINHIEERAAIKQQEETKISHSQLGEKVDFSDVKGQEGAKRALIIAAAGGHNVLMSGPPGTGKTMLAQALSSILPVPNIDEVVEMTQIYSSAGLLNGRPYIAIRPFRAPHQTASAVAVMGGGQNPRPGEISLAHRGVLFLDEVAEFRRDLLEALRQPLESGSALISRVRGNLEFPANFILVAAMNPCPCGFYRDEERDCKCSANEILRYQKKLSGPLLDRIDIQIELPRVAIEKLRREDAGSSSSFDIRNQVASIRAMQMERFEQNKIRAITNADLSSKEIEKFVALDSESESLVRKMFDANFISPRGYYRILKVARTIADLEGIEQVSKDHISEAFGYRVRENAENRM
ncbi:MAG: YifB family Mg chelatase-like AAA ATPase [bacterium]|nr:YifB family Mg chelatase-like AAA ATPase [bacterium]